MYNSGVSLADIAAVTDRNGNDGFGGNNGWWVLVILFALFGGWGNGYGGYGNGGGQFTQADMQRGFDTNNIINGIRGLERGVCDLGYSQLSQTNQIMAAQTQNQIANMQSFNALQAQLAECCCENRAAIAQVRYDMATDTCSINTAIDRLGDRIEGRLTAMEMARKDETIAELRAQLNVCGRDSALQGTASYIINAVRPTPIPSWNVANPWAGCGCNSGCGSNWNNGCC